MMVFPETREQHEAVIRWTADQMGRPVDPTGKTALAVERNGDIIAGIFYSGYTGGDIQIALAATDPRWCTPGNMRVILGYPFLQLGTRRLSAVCHVKNDKVHRLMKGLGFMREGKLHDFFEDGHGIVYGMTRRYFLRSKFNDQ